MADWRDVVGYEGLYKVSDDGRVWSHKRNKVMRGSCRRGYRRICLTNKRRKKSYFIHKLLLIAFVGPNPEGMQTCHNNGIRDDNRLDNLRWDTPKNNEKDKLRHGTHQRGEKSANAKLTENDVRQITNLHQAGMSHAAIARKVGDILPETIGLIIRGKNWSWLTKIKYKKGKRYRNNQGSHNGQSKLTEKDVLKILELYCQGKTRQQIANIIGKVRPNAIAHILTGSRWQSFTHIPYEKGRNAKRENIQLAFRNCTQQTRNSTIDSLLIDSSVA